MKVIIEIETEDNELSLLHSLLADIIAETARGFDSDKESTQEFENDNCGFQYTCKITQD